MTERPMLPLDEEGTDDTPDGPKPSSEDDEEAPLDNDEEPALEEEEEEEAPPADPEPSADETDLDVGRDAR